MLPGFLCLFFCLFYSGLIFVLLLEDTGYFSVLLLPPYVEGGAIR